MDQGGPGFSEYEAVVGRVLAASSVVVRADDVVYLTNGLDIAWVSDSVTAALGWSPGDLVGEPALTLVSPHQDLSWVDANRHRLLAGRDVAQRILIRAKDGSERWFSGVAHPASGRGGIDGFVAVLHDVSVELPEAPVTWYPAVDEATGVESRATILGFLDDALTSPDEDLCVLMVEFENLRVVNESLGHEAGDLALAEFARRMRRSLTGGERIGRVSGKTFLVACLHAPSPEDLSVRAASLVGQWSDEMEISGRRIEPDVVAAVVEARSGSTALTLMRDADVALSDARRSGESVVTVFDPEMSNRAVRRFVIEDELRFALDADEFELFFQPIVSLSDGSAVAAEALVRWRHPREGLLGPPSFLPIAEESRLIRPIGRRVLVRALEALAALPPHALQIGVNISAVELSDETWLDGVTYAIDRSGIDPCCLVLELTETAVLSARRDLRDDLRALRDRGVGVFLDDFGTGYSSLSMLRDLPVSGIKLDKSFVTALEDKESFGAALAQGIVDLVRPLGLAGVAEGIETPEQAERLAHLGWEFGQGYLFGRPGPFRALPPGRSRSVGH